MTDTDYNAIQTARPALEAAIAALKVAYKASADCRLESLIADTLNAIEEAAADLNVIEGQIEDDAADRNPDSVFRPWYRTYAAA